MPGLAILMLGRQRLRFAHACAVPEWGRRYSDIAVSNPRFWEDYNPVRFQSTRGGFTLKVALLASASILTLTLTLQAAAATNSMNHVNNAMSAHSMTINLGAQNGSKQDGQAFLNDTPAGLRVKIQVKNEPAGAVEPAHIHEGTCAKLNPAPWKALANVVGGVSVTNLSGLTLAALKKAHYAINVHQSAAHLTHYVSCGDL
jgi:hypothetical protein